MGHLSLYLAKPLANYWVPGSNEFSHWTQTKKKSTKSKSIDRKISTLPNPLILMPYVPTQGPQRGE